MKTNNEIQAESQTEGQTTETALSKRTLRNCFLRWVFLGELGWNYERMQGLGYCYTMMPALRKMYGDDEEAMQKAVENHLQFYNTNMYTGQIILGANLAIEPKLKSKGLEVIAALKTGLMGPLAGVGDSIFTTISTIMGSIAAYMAVKGNPTGVILWVALGVAFLALRWGLFQIGYQQGKHSVDTIAQHMKPITDAASVIGLTVVGALVVSVISIHAPGTLAYGEVSQSVQDLLDSIMPGLLPFLTVLGCYGLLGRKGMSSNKLIMIVFVLGLVLGCTGIFAK